MMIPTSRPNHRREVGRGQLDGLAACPIFQIQVWRPVDQHAWRREMQTSAMTSSERSHAEQNLLVWRKQRADEPYERITLPLSIGCCGLGNPRLQRKTRDRSIPRRLISHCKLLSSEVR